MRKEKGYSQKYAASQLQISQALLSHYEKGIRECGLAFLVRCADFYEVSCDYLLGRSPERSGSTITVDELPENDNLGKGNTGRNLMPLLNKKLMVNSLGIVFDLLGKTENKVMIQEASHYMMTPVYQVFRLLYSANKENEMSIFSIPEEVSSQLSSSSMMHSQAVLKGCIAGLHDDNCETLSSSGRTLLDLDSIERIYPAQSSSLLNLVQNTEKKIKSL